MSTLQIDTINVAIPRFALHASQGKTSNIHERHSQQIGNQIHTDGSQLVPVFLLELPLSDSRAEIYTTHPSMTVKYINTTIMRIRQRQYSALHRVCSN